MLFTIYINDLTSVITHSQPAAYIDDSQLHIKFSVSDSSSAMAAVNQDLTDISKWFAKNSLLINPEKTKLVVVGSVQLIKRLPHISLSLLGKLFHQCQLLDHYLTYDVHVTKTVSSCMNQLVQIGRIKQLLDKKTLLLLINSFVFSKLFFVSQYGGTHLNVSSVVSGLKKFDHISQGRRSLKWLDVTEKVIFNDLVLVLKCVNG